MHTDFEDKHLALFCALQISLKAQIFSFRDFHPVCVAVGYFHCHCDDSDIMGCHNRPNFATIHDYMVIICTFILVIYLHFKNQFKSQFSVYQRIHVTAYFKVYYLVMNGRGNKS